jgi:hypothetical protein
MSLSQFKFFQKKERLTIQWMDEMDDYHLGGIRHVEERRISPIRTFALNVLTNGIFGRVPSYLTMFERIGDNPQRVDNVNVRGNITIRDLIEDSLGVGLYFLILKIHRLSDGTEVEINYENVDELNAQNLVFNLDDYVTIYCRQV